jgi:hypothetical protein
MVVYNLVSAHKVANNIRNRQRKPQKRAKFYAFHGFVEGKCNIYANCNVDGNKKAAHKMRRFLYDKMRYD